MKKIWVPIVLACYLAVSSGVIVNFHYCMNRLASAELFATGGKQCGKCGMDMHKAHGCCRDEVKIVKMDNDQKLNPAISFELPPLELLSVLTSEFIVTSFHNVAGQRHYQNHSPPLITEEDIYLQNCVFRI
jgi:hypothetical protein